MGPGPPPAPSGKGAIRPLMKFVFPAVGQVRNNSALEKCF